MTKQEEMLVKPSGRIFSRHDLESWIRFVEQNNNISCNWGAGCSVLSREVEVEITSMYENVNRDQFLPNIDNG